MAASFVPRAVFPAQLDLPRSYFLGHHAAGLSKMKKMLSSIDLVIECRDFRIPLTSRNPLFEQALAGRERLFVYTKRDLGPKDRKLDDIIRKWHSPSSVFFSNPHKPNSSKTILNFLKEFTAARVSLTGFRILVVGMPNIGKSSLLNALRQVGVGRPKAARTGGNPGVTRKISSGVKIVDPDPEKGIETVVLVDTPGVFVPYVQDTESMLKLALCGVVKSTLIAPTTIADYLLYQMNLHQPSLYSEYMEPTNDIMELISAFCKKTGRLKKGGVPDYDAGALMLIHLWQTKWGTFILDEVTQDAYSKKIMEIVGTSVSQARKQQKDAQRAKGTLGTAELK